MDVHLRELGLPAAATRSDVRAAFKRGAARWHPDKLMHASATEQGHAGARFTRIRQAYEALMQC